jgi:hypothetical protein
MKHRIEIGHSPLNGDRDLDGGRIRAQEQRSPDVVVIGEGDEGGELEMIFDLAAFEIEGELRRERRSPVTGCVVQFKAVDIAAVALAIGEDGAEQLEPRSHIGEIGERLL